MRAFLAHPPAPFTPSPKPRWLGADPVPQAPTPAADPAGAKSSGAGRPRGPTLSGLRTRPAGALSPAPPRPAPDASWGGLLKAPGRRDSTAEPQGYGSCFRATRRALFCRRESALPAPPVRRSPKRAPRAGAGRGPGCGAVRLEPAP